MESGRTLRRHFKDNYSGPENLESGGNEPFVGRGALLIHNAEDHSGEVNSKEHGTNSGNKSQSEEKSKNYSTLALPCHNLGVSTFTIRNKKTA
ncbi:ATP-dependent RNA helicase MAK5 [Frankliniella fusca]|uniref:ATP-dependent RNA helicase MAK5 n=1 Tax=Frankliniella fusca TaxID=407009 RepID=A0AAE1L8F5_9NEOP|nr:ATP-dependent RNA helicase MAK5 [Frankliniella fusca]